MSGHLDGFAPDWLRRTAATHQADAGNHLCFNQQNLRHVLLETTAIFRMPTTIGATRRRPPAPG